MLTHPLTALVTGPCALVSGATGFLGGYLAADLQRRGWRVRALARRTSDLRFLEQLGVEIVFGDLADRDSLARAAHGQRFVFHTAGKVSDWGAREEFWRANVEGTANVIEACRQAGVERLIHLSSLTVLGLPRDGRLVDEQTPYAAAASDPYTASKIAGEQLARVAHGERLQVTVVRPGVIWGPGDVTIVPRFAALLRRGVLVYVDGGANLLGLSHVENLAQGVRLAAEVSAAAGEVYHITDGEELTARQVLEELAHGLGTAPPRLSLPFGAVHAMAALCEAGGRAFGRRRPPALTRYGVRLAACHCRYDLSKAREQLGYQPRVSFRDGMAVLCASGALV